MSGNTKSRILEAALEIFSREGYAAAGLKEIAESVGVVKSAFYRHYASKEDVWNAVLDQMEGYYEEHFGSPRNLPEIPKSTEELKDLTMAMLEFTMHDPKILMTRKLLMTEQFHDVRARALATEHFNVGLENLFTRIFAGMIENGSLKNADPAMLAFAYTAPVSTLVHLCDREPEKEADIMHKIERFISHFTEVYGA